MRIRRREKSFSLTEVLLAMATLSVGMLFIAGVFPVAIHYSTIATERTIAAAAADEAFAKVRLYLAGDETDPNAALDPAAVPGGSMSAIEDLGRTTLPFAAVSRMEPSEFSYPSTEEEDLSAKKYFWSALCRRVGPLEEDRLIQVTVFVCRRPSPNIVYYAPDADADVGDAGYGEIDWNNPDTYERPVPVRIAVSAVAGVPSELLIDDLAEASLVNDGCTILDDDTGRPYRVRERYRGDQARIVRIDPDWQGNPTDIWLVAPPAEGGRNPCIAVYQKVLRL